jgi:transposase
MPRKSPYILTLNAAQLRELEARSRRYTLPYREVVRAKIVLMAAEGLDNDQIVARLDTRREIVSKWRKRFFEDGLGGSKSVPGEVDPRSFPLRW